MKNLSLIVPYDYKLLSIAAILDVFETVNRIHDENKREKPFGVQIIQTPEQIKKCGCTFHGYPVRSIKSKQKADVVLIPAFTTGNMMETISKNQPYISWIRRQYAEHAGIASFCTGAFLLGASGLLDGRIATTHVDACSMFAMAFPSVVLKADQVITIDGQLYTSGGATSMFLLLLHIIQKYCGSEMAVRIAKIFAIDIDRYRQNYFGTFVPNYNHNDDLVKRVQKNIEANFPEIGSIEEIIKDIPSSRRNLVRRFKQATGIPPIGYLQNVRIEEAKKQLEQTNQNISEIIEYTGYSDPKSFRKTFVKIVGMTPLEYREKFRAI